MSIKGLLFDFDGTLFFNSDLHARAIGRVFEQDHGLPMPDDHTLITRIFGRPNPEIYRDMVDPHATEEQMNRFDARKEEEFQALCLEHPDRLHLVEGAVELLNYLKKNQIPYAIATCAPRTNVEFYWKHLGLGNWFDESNMVYGDGSFPGKPAPDIYLMAAEKLGLASEECAVFEDGASGIEAAVRAGCGAIIALYDKRFDLPNTSKAQSDSIYHDLTDWRNILAHYGLMR